MWGGIGNLIEEIKRCEAAGATMSAVAMAYICIDTMAFLGMPEDKEIQSSKEFVDWVDTYLKGHADQPYQYRGIDVYAARCSVLHTFGSEAALHRANPDIKLFGYHDGGKHAYNAEIDPRLVIIGTASFLNDVILAVEAFLRACQQSEALRSRVGLRLEKVLQLSPLARSMVKEGDAKPSA